MLLLNVLALLNTLFLNNSPLSFVGNLINDIPVTTHHDTYLTPIQIIRKYDYPAEAHIARTKDGYLLELHRIPYGKVGKTNKERIPVLLFHGYLSSSLSWLANGPEKSLAYRLADEGYDIWMGNMRGNEFSKAHVKYTPSEKPFWDFSLTFTFDSFDEIGLIDLPATIDYILNVTNHQRLFYIGHSAGNNILYFMTSDLPQYNDKIIGAIGLAAALTIPNSKQIVYLNLLPSANFLKVLNNLGIRGSFLEPNILVGIIDKYLCNFKIGDKNLCGLAQMASNGWDLYQFNSTLAPMLIRLTQSGTSLRCLLHLLQYINPGTFIHFDYGEKENLERYGTPTPPPYNVTNIKIPVKVYYGGNDIIITPKDSEALYEALPNPYGLMKIDQFNHLDFVMAKDINRLLNDNVIETIHNITNSNSHSSLQSESNLQSKIIQNLGKSETVPLQNQNNTIILSRGLNTSSNATEP